MAELLKGAAVAAALDKKTTAAVATLRSKGVDATLAILRVGERADDVSYERGAIKRCSQTGIRVKQVTLPRDVQSHVFFSTLDSLNHDDAVHGILMFRPLPGQIDEDQARQRLFFEKDVDGSTDPSLAGVFTGVYQGFPPCTAQAAIEMLDYYQIPCEGKRAVVIGRSLVIGRPVSMMLLQKNATVTICHTRTQNICDIAREADILITCTGKMESIGKDYLRKGQTVIDVGIGWNEEKGKLCGDVRWEEAVDIVDRITPVPGGVGSVTTSVLMSHVAKAAERMMR